MKSKENARSAHHHPQALLRNTNLLDCLATAATNDAGHRQHPCTILPTPQQHRSTHHHSGDGAGGQKFPSQGAAAASPAWLGKTGLTASRSRREDTATGPSAPWRASPRWDQSPGPSYSTSRRHHHQNGAAWKTSPNPIYKPGTKHRGSPLLPPPQRRTEERGTRGLVG